jgi:hypothetical protein
MNIVLFSGELLGAEVLHRNCATFSRKTKQNKLRGLSPRPNYTYREPPLLGEISANFYWYRVPRCRRDGSLRPYSRLYRPEPQFFLLSSSSIVPTRLSGHRSRPTASQKMWHRRESNSELCICSQEFWSPDRRVHTFLFIIYLDMSSCI